jgi:hypothetical protein
VQHRQETEVAAAETAATAARAARLVMAELTAARAEVEAAAATDAARVAAAELKALRASSTGSSISGDDDRDNELQGRRGGSSPDRCGRAGGWVDGDRGLYRRRDSPSPDRYHGDHGIQAIVRDIGPGAGWPTLCKTNYVEWAAVMRVRLQVRHMWEAVRYGDVDYYEDRRALDALIAAVPSEMQFSLSKKQIAKEAWDAIAAACIGSDRARKTTLQALRKEWENLAFKPGEETSLSVLTLCSRRWCSSAMTPTARREPSRSSSGASPRSTSRSLDRVSAGPLHDVN